MNKKKVYVKVFRHDPESDEEPRFETYNLPYRSGMFVLDALIYIYENFDSGLAFQHSCRSRRCGSCAVLVDNVPALACMEKIEKDITVQPLPGFQLVKDLVVDFSSSDEKIVKIKPFQHVKTLSEELEILPSDSIQNYIDSTKCIGCYICFSECPVIKETSNVFEGPEVFFSLARHAYDPRDKVNRENEANSYGIYQCTSCSSCEISCPKELSPIDMIINLRRMTLEKGLIEPTMRDALESIYKHGNPWERIRSKRSDWANDMTIKHVSDDTDLLYFIGCTPAYDPRVQNVARSLVKCFEKAGVNFGTLKNDESCCGNEVHGMGEEGLFDLLVEENIKLFNKYQINDIVTISPHCYNVFKNRYDNINFEVQHYTEYISKLIDNEKLEFSKEFERNVTYQDPCFLGKQNNIYEPPRKIIESIPGLNFIELDNSKNRSLCCGGGGGRMWIDVPSKRLSEIRVEEAIDAGAEIFATACPFCLVTLEDSVKTLGVDESFQVMDIAEILSEVI